MSSTPTCDSGSSGEAPHRSARTVITSNFLARLDLAELSELQNIAVLQRFDKGEYVFRAGAAGDNVYLLRSGKVKIHQFSPGGREVILWFCFAGEVFGLAEVARGGGRAVNAQACEASELLAVPQERFRDFLVSHPDVALLCMQVLSSRMRVLGEIFVNLVSDDVNTRIAKLIVRLAAHYGSQVGRDVVLNIPLTHQEIADMVGTSRQTVTSSLSELKRQGVLSINNHRICIESEELLKGLTQDTP